jgi:hypothetical protein
MTMPQINIDRIRRLRTHLEGIRDGTITDAPAFRMTSWFRHEDEICFLTREVEEARDRNVCGTAACLAGHTVWLFAHEHAAPLPSEIADAGRVLLNLDIRSADMLFTPYMLQARKIDQAIWMLQRIEANHAAGIVDDCVWPDHPRVPDVTFEVPPPTADPVGVNVVENPEN